MATRAGGRGRGDIGILPLVALTLLSLFPSAVDATPRLTALSVSSVSAPLTPSAFDPDVLSYAASVENTVFQVALDYALETPSDTTVSVGVVAVGASGRRRLMSRRKLLDTTAMQPVSVGRNDITLTLTRSSDGTTRSYVLSVTRLSLSTHATLTSLTFSHGTLTPGPSYSVLTTSYDLNTAFAESSVTLTPTSQDSGATIQVNGVASASGVGVVASLPIYSDAGANVVAILVTAPDGVTTTTYTISVYRAPPPPPPPPPSSPSPPPPSPSPSPPPRPSRSPPRTRRGAARAPLATARARARRRAPKRISRRSSERRTASGPPRMVARRGRAPARALARRAS